MIGWVVFLALAGVGYRFDSTTKLDYDVEFAFDGQIPVMGGIDGKAKTQLGIEVRGLTGDKVAPLKATYELKSFRLFVGEDELPYGIDKVQSYFPKTTLWFNQLGKVVKNDAPDLSIPVRLPGLDGKRFADVTFLAIEFPDKEITIDSKWKFEKTFGDSVVVYNVKVTTIKNDRIEFDLNVSQAYDVLEDESMNIVKTVKDAISKVHTDMVGTGKATFDSKLGIILALSISSKSTSQVTDLKTQRKTTRNLKVDTHALLRDKHSPPWKTS